MRPTIPLPTAYLLLLPFLAIRSFATSISRLRLRARFYRLSPVWTLLGKVQKNKYKHRGRGKKES
jgi:hypothetical protein